MAEAEASVVPAERGRTFTVGPDLVEVKVEAAATDDAMSVIGYRMPADGQGPPAHVHPDVHEVLVLLACELEFLVGTERVRAGVGTVAHIPPGVPHIFFNLGVEARWIGIFSPGHGLDLLEDIGKAFPADAGPPDGMKLAQTFERHRVQLVEPS
jgi:mannose-6-phosphate isomerase-like protein (cupin superfamily)